VKGARARVWLGALLIGTLWPANWLLTGLRTQLLFFPLWLGYVLLFDGGAALTRGRSLCSRSPGGFLRLFLVSVPLWWLFEAANQRLGNWEYLGREHFGDLEYALLCSLAFSTVVPAVLVSAEWVRGWAWIERLGPGPRLQLGPWARAVLFVLGLGAFALLLRWPTRAYPLLWVGGVFLLEALLPWLGRRSLASDLARGDWRPWISLWIGVGITAFFWELWNLRSYPKWIYHLPGIDAPRLFEMPWPGYLGYLPFALEVYLWKELWLRQPELLRSPSEQGAPDARSRPDGSRPVA